MCDSTQFIENSSVAFGIIHLRKDVS
jgi:hypothetical protein